MRDRKKNNYDRIMHIEQSIERIEHYTNEIDQEAFLTDGLISSAVLFQFSVIGEAIIHIESDLLERYDYEWYKVRSFRNLISHEYFNIKLEAVWQIVIKDLPELKSIVLEIIRTEF